MVSALREQVMNTRPTFPIAIIMRRRRLAHPWATDLWEAEGVIQDRSPPHPRGECIVAGEDASQYLFGGFALELFLDEAEGYFLNVSAPEPKVFIMWRVEEVIAMPTLVTVSYVEAARWLDAGENVDGVPMPPQIFAWLGAYVERCYQPEPKKVRKRDQSPFQEHGKHE